MPKDCKGIFTLTLLFILTLIHVLIWGFVLLAFLRSDLARLNLYAVIPAIFIIHLLPIHIINSMKESLCPQTWEKKSKELANYLIFPYIFYQFKKLFTKSFSDPLSAQGMLIIGALSSAYTLRKEQK